MQTTQTTKTKAVPSIARGILMGCLLVGGTGNVAAQMPDASAPTVGLADQTLQVTVDYYSSRGSFTIPETDGVDAERLERRKGDLWGGTLTYGHSATLYFDVSYFTGSTDYAFSETFTDPQLGGLNLVNRGDVDEDWFEGRVRWQPERFAFQRVQAYTSLGITHIRTDDSIRSDVTLPGVDLGLDDILTMEGKSRNSFANLGLGIGGIRPAGRVNIGFKAELSLLGGRVRVNNTLYNPDGSGAVIDEISDRNSVWGTITRGSVFLNVPFGGDDTVRGAFTAEVGARHYYWRFSGGSERNYGPFGKAGVAFRF